MLHDPLYREKYALNLKREFPRIPFYPDFWQWADWGKTLMDLHIGYESVAPFEIKRTDASPSPQPSPRKRGEGAVARAETPKALLNADKDAGLIRLDTETTLAGIPDEAWSHKLGNRSALEWILDQHKEKTPKDPTIREKFNTYRFADYKEKVVDLPESWRTRLGTSLEACVTVRIEPEAEARVASDEDPDDPLFGMWRDRA